MALRVLVLSVLTLAVTGAIVAACVYQVVLRGFEGHGPFEAECALVFGAAVHSGDSPGPGIVRRVWTAARLYGEGKVQRLVLTGGKGEKDMRSEAAVMRDVAMEAGVRSRDILIEDQSHSTVENLRNSRPLITDCETVIGVSDNYHLARIRLLAEQMGWSDLRTIGTDARPPEGFERASVQREVLAYLYYALHLTSPESADM